MDTKKKRKVVLGVVAGLALASVAVALLYDDKKNYKKLSKELKKASKKAKANLESASKTIKEKYADGTSMAKEKYNQYIKN